MIEVGERSAPGEDSTHESGNPVLRVPPEMLTTWYLLQRDLDALGFGSADVQLLRSGWVHHPLDSAGTNESGRPEREIPIRSEDVRYSISLDFLDDLMRYVSGFAGGSEATSIADFRAQFLRRISETKWPGWAWALVAYKSTVERLEIRSVREGGGFGVQIPLAGSPTLTLDPDQWHLVLRVLPIAGNYEEIEILDENGDWHDSQRFPIQVRPTLEAEFSYRGARGYSDFQPGVRFLVQTRVTDFEDVRATGEIFVRYRINRGNRFFESFDIVPRCMFEFNRQNPLDDGFHTTEQITLVESIARKATCFMHISANFEG